MPGALVIVNAVALCAHGGKAQAVVPSPRVQAAGMPVVTVASPFAVAGCPNMLGPAPFPCVLASFPQGATRVQSMNQPVLLADSAAIATPTGAKVSVLSTQPRVRGQ